MQQGVVGLERGGPVTRVAGDEPAQEVGEVAGLARWRRLPPGDPREQSEDVAGVGTERGMALDGGVQRCTEGVDVGPGVRALAARRLGAK